MLLLLLAWVFLLVLLMCFDVVASVAVPGVVTVVAVVRVVDVVVVGSAVTMITFHLSPLLHDRPILQMKNFGSSAF